MRLPVGGRQAQVVRAHDRGGAGSQAPFQAGWISRRQYQAPGFGGSASEAERTVSAILP